MLDEDFRVWLIECNTNPFLGTPNDYMKQLVPQMLDDVFRLVVDPVFPPQTHFEGVDRENLWELCYAE